MKSKAMSKNRWIVNISKGGRFDQSVLYLPSKVPIYLDWDTLCTVCSGDAVQEFLRGQIDKLHDLCLGGRGLISVLFRCF